MSADENRREVSARKITIFHKLAKTLVKAGLHPNHISVFSSIFAIAAGLAFWKSGADQSLGCTIAYLVVAIIGIQFRLICNLIDGLMAVEGGLKTPTGEIYNDYPDRISDVAILVGAGYGAAGVLAYAVELGWFAALAAVMTAYTRVLGASMGATHFFSGPMAKQHRMFLMTIAAVGAIAEKSSGGWGHALTIGLELVCVGSVITCVRRLLQITRKINKGA